MPSNFHHPVLRHAKSASVTLQRMWGSGDRLTHVHFAYAMGIAFFLHITIYGIWLLIPKTHVMDIPVRVLNVKLGDMEDIPSEDPAPAQTQTNNADVEQIISKVVKDIQSETPHNNDVAIKTIDKAMVPANKKPSPANMEKLIAKSKPFDMRSEGVATAAPVQSVLSQPMVEKQFVRATEPAQLPVTGSKLGNSTDDKASIVARYEQLISAWIDKFKPDKLMTVGQPDRVTASVRIRIDRRGNIRYMELEKGTDFVALDRAALDTVRRANPVPAAPTDYPSGESIEFIVPIVFTK